MDQLIELQNSICKQLLDEPSLELRLELSQHMLNVIEQINMHTQPHHLIQAMSMLNKSELSSIAGHMSNELLWKFEASDRELWTANRLVKLTKEMNQCEQMGKALKTLFGVKSPTYLAWCDWQKN